MSPAASTVSPASVLALALHREHDEVAALGDHPRERGVADELRARRDHDLGDAGAPREQALAVVEAVLLDQRPRVLV